MRCARCASPNSLSSNFCSACGVRLVSAQAVQPGAIEGERRHLTVLFSDLVGSTEIAARLGPEQWHEIAARYQRSSAEAVVRFGGHVGKYLGDGLVAYFGYPEALEDAAERAVRTGLATIRVVRDLNDHYGPLHKIKLAVRVGLHSGSVVVAPGGGVDPDMFGDAPNIASRVQVAAAPDTVLITDAVHDAVAGMFIVEEAGRHRLKGVEKPLRLFRVIAPGLARRRVHGGGRKRSSFVGREEEMRTLSERCQRARAGQGQVVLITGDPGIGKSRLLEEMHALLKDEPHLWIECAGEPLFNNTPFHAVVQMFVQGLGWRGDEPNEVGVAQLRRALAAADLEVDEALPAMAELLGLPLPPGTSASQFASEEQRAHLFAALTGWVLSAARTQLVVIAIEDLHWVDPSTLELIAVLAERAPEARLLVVGTARPQSCAPWTMRSHCAQLTLSRLDTSSVRDIVRQATGEVVLTPDLVDGVVERADGVPLFAEELARLMRDSGGRAGSHEIPATLQDSLMARFDRLGAAKETAQIGAVLGREFRHDLLRALSPLSERALQSALATLASADLIYAHGIAPDIVYRFRHSLLQDAAYDALLKRQRRILHARAAQTITESFAALAESHPELLAHHWSEAGEIDNAVQAWAKSAKSAAARYAYKESADAFERALVTLATVPETADRDARELQLWRWFVGVAQIRYGYSAAQTRKATQMARRLAEKTGDVRKQFAHVAREWMAASSAGHYRTSRRLAEQLMPLAHAQATPDGMAMAHMSMLTSRFRLGDLLGAEEAFAAGEPFFSTPEFVRRPGAAAQAFGNGAMNAWVMGMDIEARRRIGVVRDIAQQTVNPYERAFSEYMAAMVALMLGDLEEAEPLARRAIDSSTEGGFPQFAATSRIILGRALAERARADEGLPLMLEGLQGMTRNRSRAALTMYLTWLAATHGACGATEQALGVAEQALTINPQEKFFRPESLRLRGLMRIKAGDKLGAADDLRRAVGLAKAMGANCLRTRAEESLAAMQRAAG
jgi:class 3 adenylate cyclase